MKLVYDKTGEPVKVGDTVSIRGQRGTVTDINKPHKPSSTGRIYVKIGSLTHEFFPGVIGATWVEREDWPVKERDEL